MKTLFPGLLLILLLVIAQTALAAEWRTQDTQEFHKRLTHARAQGADPRQIGTLVTQVAQTEGAVDAFSLRGLSQTLAEVLRENVRFVTSPKPKGIIELAEANRQIESIAGFLKAASTKRDVAFAPEVQAALMDSIEDLATKSPHDLQKPPHLSTIDRLTEAVSAARFDRPTSPERIRSVSLALSGNVDRRIAYLQALRSTPGVQAGLVEVLEALPVTPMEYKLRAEAAPGIQRTSAGTYALTRPTPLSQNQRRLEQMWTLLTMKPLEPELNDRVRQLLSNPSNLAKSATALVVSPQLVQQVRPALPPIEFELLVQERTNWLKGHGRAVDPASIRAELSAAVAASRSGATAVPPTNALLNLPCPDHYGHIPGVKK